MRTLIYSDSIPPLLAQLAETPAMQRLLDVGMHCGCEYTKFPILARARRAYSRYEHSVGVASMENPCVFQR